jgi:RHS repeat-associated protein
MYREDGETVWTCELNSYGKVRNWQGEVKTDCPFRFQGQYEDAETGLYYNRFRYYDPSIGNYISQDPIGLAGGNPTLYGYVHDPNSWIDQLGLECGKKVKIGDEIAPNSKVRRIKEGTNGKTIIIGRNMDDRVIPSAKNLGAEYWDGFDKTLSKYDLSS